MTTFIKKILNHKSFSVDEHDLGQGSEGLRSPLSERPVSTGTSCPPCSTPSGGLYCLNRLLGVQWRPRLGHASSLGWHATGRATTTEHTDLPPDSSLLLRLAAWHGGLWRHLLGLTWSHQRRDGTWSRLTPDDWLNFAPRHRCNTSCVRVYVGVDMVSQYCDWVKIVSLHYLCQCVVRLSYYCCLVPYYCS